MTAVEKVKLNKYIFKKNPTMLMEMMMIAQSRESWTSPEDQRRDQESHSVRTMIQEVTSNSWGEGSGGRMERPRPTTPSAAAAKCD